jgi:hypothetical protein
MSTVLCIAGKRPREPLLRYLRVISHLSLLFHQIQCGWLFSGGPHSQEGQKHVVTDAASLSVIDSFSLWEFTAEALLPRRIPTAGSSDKGSGMVKRSRTFYPLGKAANQQQRRTN